MRRPSGRRQLLVKNIFSVNDGYERRVLADPSFRSRDTRTVSTFPPPNSCLTYPSRRPSWNHINHENLSSPEPVAILCGSSPLAPISQISLLLPLTKAICDPPGDTEAS